MGLCIYIVESTTVFQAISSAPRLCFLSVSSIAWGMFLVDLVSGEIAMLGSKKLLLFLLDESHRFALVESRVAVSSHYSEHHTSKALTRLAAW